MEQKIQNEISRLIHKHYHFSLFAIGLSALASCSYIYLQKATTSTIAFWFSIAYFGLFIIAFFVEKYFLKKLKIEQNVLSELAKRDQSSINHFFDDPMEEIQDGFFNKTATFFFTTLTFFFFAIGEKFVQGSLWITRKENGVNIEEFKPEFIPLTLIYVLVLALPIWLAYTTLSDVARGAKIKTTIKRAITKEKKRTNKT